jgi:hypothetical protein
MKNGDFSGVTATVPPASNGAHPSLEKGPGKSPGKKRTALKGSGKSAVRNGVSPAPFPIAEEFAEIEPKPIDAPMWLLHPVSWLQAERSPSVPLWTGLAIERHYRIPRPEFMPLETAAPNRPGALDNSCAALAAEPRCELPQSDLAPLGWDPRAVCRKEDNR